MMKRIISRKPMTTDTEIGDIVSALSTMPGNLGAGSDWDEIELECGHYMMVQRCPTDAQLAHPTAMKHLKFVASDAGAADCPLAAIIRLA